MTLPISYAQLLLACLGGLLFVIIVVVFRRRFALRSAECQMPAEHGDPQEHYLYTEYIVPMLVFEERYPSFVAILDLVLSRFPLSRFSEQEDFRSALEFLKEAALNGGEPKRIATVMCILVQSFVNDLDVEYDLRLQLPDLLHRFLEEIGAPTG